jgi:hypothetical protein
LELPGVGGAGCEVCDGSLVLGVRGRVKGRGGGTVGEEEAGCVLAAAF